MELKFKMWLEAQMSNYVYHVTYAGNLSSIAANGLVPNGNGSPFFGKGQWSAGKNFFSTSLSNAKFWIDKIQYLLDINAESGGWNPNNFVNQMQIPVILRFRFNQRPTTNRWQADTQSDVGRNDYYTDRSIDSTAIEWWDGQRWQSIHDDNIDINRFVYQDFEDPGLEDEEPDDPSERFYWRWREPYPMP